MSKEPIRLYAYEIWYWDDNENKVYTEKGVFNFDEIEIIDAEQDKHDK